MSRKPCKLGFISQFHFRYKNKCGTPGSFFAPLGRVREPQARTTCLTRGPAMPSIARAARGHEGRKARGRRAPGDWVWSLGGRGAIFYGTEGKDRDRPLLWQPDMTKERTATVRFTVRLDKLQLCSGSFNISLLLSTILLNAPSYRQTGCLTAGVPASSVVQPTVCKEPSPWPCTCVDKSMPWEAWLYTHLGE